MKALELILFSFVLYFPMFIYANDIIWNDMQNSEKNPIWFNVESERKSLIKFYEENKSDFPKRLNHEIARAYLFETKKGDKLKYAPQIIELYNRSIGDEKSAEKLYSMAYIALSDENKYGEAMKLGLRVYDSRRNTRFKDVNRKSFLGLKMACLAIINGKLLKNFLYETQIGNRINDLLAGVRQDPEMESIYLSLIMYCGNNLFSSELLNKLGDKIYSGDPSLLSARYLLLKKFIGTKAADNFYKAVREHFVNDSEVIDSLNKDIESGKLRLNVEMLNRELRDTLYECAYRGIM